MYAQSKFCILFHRQYTNNMNHLEQHDQDYREDIGSFSLEKGRKNEERDCVKTAQ